MTRSDGTSEQISLPYEGESKAGEILTLEGVIPRKYEGKTIRFFTSDETLQVFMDGTPIYDIKPYIPYADAHPDAVGGFAREEPAPKLQVDFPPRLLSLVPEDRRQALIGVLALDPRPSYQEDAARVYGMSFAEFNIRFTVHQTTLTVCAVEPASSDPRNSVF